MSLSTSPIVMDTKPANNSASSLVNPISIFNSYNFDRNILTPASAFRFTAPGLDVATRLAIRSGDMAELFAVRESDNQRFQIATGFIDETDTHGTPNSIEYVLTGRDTLGQLVDNASVDANNKIINTTQVSLTTLLSLLIANTRIPSLFTAQNVPNGLLLVNTNGGETKITTLQRYLEFTNCLVWSAPNGTLVLGKPNFAQQRSGFLVASISSPDLNNILDFRVRRNTNQAIRQIVTQLQSEDQVDAGVFTVLNRDTDVQAVAPYKVGRSVYERFTYGQGNDAVNQIVAVGNQNGSPQAIGAAFSRREIARENMKVLDVEIVCQGHFNAAGFPYNIDQIYNVQIEDENLSEDLYVYACSYELTLEHGILTRLKLCRVGTTLVDGGPVLAKS